MILKFTFKELMHISNAVRRRKRFFRIFYLLGNSWGNPPFCGVTNYKGLTLALGSTYPLGYGLEDKLAVREKGFLLERASSLYLYVALEKIACLDSKHSRKKLGPCLFQRLGTSRILLHVVQENQGPTRFLKFFLTFGETPNLPPQLS